MRILLAAAFLVLPVPIAGAAGSGPTVTIVRRDGAPFVDMTKTVRSCEDRSDNRGLRQRILDNAAREWAAFEFPRFAITALKSYNVIPPGISFDETKTRASAGYVARILPIGVMEDDDSVRARIGSYWAATPKAQADEVFTNQNQIWKLSQGRAGWAEYWSAAFISFVMCKAGLNNEEFRRDSSHVSYIRPAVAKRDGSNGAYAYTAYNLAEAGPQPGDLVCAARDDTNGTIDDLQKFRENPAHGSYHCDIIVGFDRLPVAKAGVAYAIGGNVINAVTLTEMPMGNGKLLKVRVPHGRNWFTILKLDLDPTAADFKSIPGDVTALAERSAKRAAR